MTTGSEIVTGGSAAAITAHLLAYAKERGWITTIAQFRAIAALAAFLTSLGVTLTFDSATGAWVMSGTLMGVVVGLGHMVAQYGAIDLAFKQWARIKLAKIFDQGV